MRWTWSITVYVWPDAGIATSGKALTAQAKAKFQRSWLAWMKQREAGSTVMAPLFFSCPKTHQHAPTGIETDMQSLRASWKATLKISCPHCGEVHKISVREMFINGALPDATDRLCQVS
jgi:hypothetical protein